MKRWQPGYKVVACEPNTFSSLTYIPSENLVEYKINKSATPSLEAGPLAVFNSIINCLSFLQVNNWRQHIENKTAYIMECAFIQSKHKKLWLHNGEVSYGHSTYLPEGTALADEVMLLGKHESCLEV